MRGGTASQAIVARSATGSVADVAISAATIVFMLAAALGAVATTAMPAASATGFMAAAIMVLVSNGRRDESQLQGRFQIAGPQPDEHCK